MLVVVVVVFLGPIFMSDTYTQQQNTTTEHNNKTQRNKPIQETLEHQLLSMANIVHYLILNPAPLSPITKFPFLIFPITYIYTCIT